MISPGSLQLATLSLSQYTPAPSVPSMQCVCIVCKRALQGTGQGESQHNFLTGVHMHFGWSIARPPQAKAVHALPKAVCSPSMDNASESGVESSLPRRTLP